jgi:hypothetical protein
MRLRTVATVAFLCSLSACSSGSGYLDDETAGASNGQVGNASGGEIHSLGAGGSGASPGAGTSSTEGAAGPSTDAGGQATGGVTDTADLPSGGYVGDPTQPTGGVLTPATPPTGGASNPVTQVTGGAPNPETAASGGAGAMPPATGGVPTSGGASSTGGRDWRGQRDTGGAPGTGGGLSTGGFEPLATGGDWSTGGAPGTGGAGATTSSDPFEQARIDCVDRINAFRATEGKPPYERWVDAEACTDEQAQLDSESNSAHGHFEMCGEWAQNTCPWWPSLDSIITGCLQQMWDEGPGEPFSAHGHYINMSSTEYTRVACGFYQGPDGTIWANQNFK